jgi:hypothetical protein
VIPASREAETRQLRFKASSAKVSDTLSEEKSQAWWCMPVVPSIREVKVGGSWLEASLGKVA